MFRAHWKCLCILMIINTVTHIYIYIFFFSVCLQLQFFFVVFFFFFFFLFFFFYFVCVCLIADNCHFPWFLTGLPQNERNNLKELLSTTAKHSFPTPSEHAKKKRLVNIGFSFSMGKATLKFYQMVKGTKLSVLMISWV